MLLTSTSEMITVGLAVIFLSIRTESVSVFPSCVYNCTDVGFPGSYSDCASCHRFLICVGRRTLVVTCPKFLFYDHVIGVCTYHKPARCSLGSETGEQKMDISEQVFSASRGKFLPTTLPEWLSHPRPAPTACVINCSEVNFSGRYADCSSCSTMVVCIGTRMTKVQCPPPLHYDPHIGVCNYHWKVQCRKQLGNGIRVQTKTKSGHAVRKNGKCIKDCSQVSIPGKYASCHSCSKFVLCVGKKMFLLNCPKKLLFDSNNKFCTFAKKVDCRDEIDGFLTPPDVSKTISSRNVQIKPIAVSLSDVSSLDAESPMNSEMENLLNFVTNDTDPPPGTNVDSVKTISKPSKNRAGNSLISLKMLFCKTFNGDFNFNLSLCEKRLKAQS